MALNSEIPADVFSNFFLSLLYRKIVVPSDYHSQCKVVKEMLTDDVTGLVDSLTDFAVNAASVKFTVETKNVEFNAKLRYWMDNINKDFNGVIPRGIDELAKEYYKERWKASSFPIVKILKWEVWEGLVVPAKMALVDGESIYADNKTTEETKAIGDYVYYIGSALDPKEKLGKGIIITKPMSRWFDKYPVPYLIKKGCYHNYKIIKSLKDKQTEILDQIIPYLLLVKKGTENLAVKNIKTYNDDELALIRQQFQDFKDEMAESTGTIKSPIRTSQFDEEIKHLIPDLSVIFNKDLFAVAERNILAGLGFVDVFESTSSSRRELVLNPKIFVETVKSGVNDFKNHILKELISQIIEKNSAHRKYINQDFFIMNSPITGFQSDDFKNLIKQLYNYGKISAQTAVEMVAETDFETEVYRREKERKDGIEEKMYPQVVQNLEEKGFDTPGAPKKEDGVNGKPIPEEKKNQETKEKYSKSTEETLETIEDLTGAPYQDIKDLPPAVKKLKAKERRTWMRAFNSAYYYKLGKTGSTKEAESYAFPVAWAAVNKTKEEK